MASYPALTQLLLGSLKKNLFDYWVLLTVFAPGDSERQQAAQWKLADCHRGRAFPSLWL